MEVKGNINIRSIATIGRRANEGMNVLTNLISDQVLNKYANKHQYYNVKVDCTVKLPDATGLPVGWGISFYSSHESVARASLVDYTGTQLASLSPRKTVTFILLEKGTSAGVWRQIKSGSGGTGSNGNVPLYSAGQIINEYSTSGSATVYRVAPFVASVMSGFDEAGDIVDDIIFYNSADVINPPVSYPTNKFIYISKDGNLVFSTFRQEGGNVFPSNPTEGKIFFLKPLRCNYKYSSTAGWEPYPCTAVAEIAYNEENVSTAYEYPKNEWWWDYKYGEIRNTAVISSGTVLSVPSLTGKTIGDTISGVLFGNVVVTVADGFTTAGVAVDHYVPLLTTQDTSFVLGTPTYFYVLPDGTVEASPYAQSCAGDLSGQNGTYRMVYSLKDGRNYKYNPSTTAYEPYPAVCVASVDANGIPQVYPFNTRPFDIVDAYTRIYTDLSAPIQTIVLDQEVADPYSTTINVGNTVLQTDQYQIQADKRTILFLQPVEAGVRIEVRWCARPKVNVLTHPSFHSVGEVFWSQSNSKDDNKGALPLFTGEHVDIQEYSALYFFILRNPSVYTTKEAYDALIADTTKDCPYYAIDGGYIYLPVLRNYLNTTTVTNGDLGIVPTTLYPWVSYITTIDDILTPTEYQPRLPAGSLMMGPVASMDGYILCDGRAVSRAEYPVLFAAIGTNFGIGDGSTTFNVPDYRGCFLRGFKEADESESDAYDMYTKQPMGAPNITGSAGWFNSLAGSYAYTGAMYEAGGTFTYDSMNGGSEAKNIGFDASRSNSVYGSANEIRPVNFAVNFFIKY